jgi:hypothetical protein
MKTDSERPYEEVKEAFRWAMDTGGDISNTTPEKHPAGSWRRYIKDRANLVLYEEVDEIRPKMFDVAKEVAEKEFDIPPEVLEFESDE